MIDKTDKKEANMFRFGVAADLHNFGTNEDGEAVIGFMIYIEAVSDDGQRFVHDTMFPSITVVDCEDNVHYVSDIDTAMAQANKALDMLKSSDVNVTDNDSWNLSFAVYGSLSYDEGNTIAWENSFPI